MVIMLVKASTAQNLSMMRLMKISLFALEGIAYRSNKFQNTLAVEVI